MPRRLAAVALSFVCLAATSAVGDVPTAERSARPNIVVILADDLGYGSVGCYGATAVKTPHIDRVAREGIRFTDAHTPSSVCSPTRYGVLTGRYCWRTSLKFGVLAHNAPLHVEPGRTTLASLLEDRGYATGCVGKWHLGFGPPGRKPNLNRTIESGPLDVGFDWFFGVAANLGRGFDLFIEDREVVGKRPDVRLAKEGEGLGAKTLGTDFPADSDKVGPILAQKAVQFIDRNKAQPFFLYFPTFAVHRPITPSAEYAGTSGIGPYGDVIQEFDGSVGRVLDALDRNGLAQNTLVIVTSDNGGKTADDEVPFDKGCFTQAEKGGLKSNGPWRAEKGTIYEGGHRVPFVARWPGRIPAGAVSDQTICLTDLLATVAAIVGADLPADAGEDSFDIGPALFGHEHDGAVRPAIVMHSVAGVFAIREGPWKLVPEQKPDPTLKKRGMRKKFDADAFGQLYNLADDPQETKNLYQDRPEIVARLGRLLGEYQQSGRSGD